MNQKILKNLKNKYIYQNYFNLPIEFDNQELYYYKYTQIIINVILSLNKSLFRIRKNIIKIILDKKLFFIQEIINNEKKIDFLMIILLKDTNYYQNTNLERLKINYTKDEINDFIQKNPSYQYDVINNSINFLSNSFISLSLNEYCLNLINKEDLCFEDMLNFESVLKKHQFIEYEDRIKQY